MIIRKIAGLPANLKRFSFGCLVTDWKEFEELAASLLAMGFDDANSEFLVIDNTKTNVADGFEALRIFSAHARGEFLVIVHQDVRFLQTADELLSRIGEISSQDPGWGVLGNAGKTRDNLLNGPIAITDGASTYRQGPFPRQVESLDENLLILKRSAGLLASADLKGFHFYGFDLCQVARRLGYSAYVIDFMVRHESAGTIDAAFYAAMRQVEEKYQRLQAPTTLATTCGVLCWDRSFWKRSKALVMNYLILRTSLHHEVASEMLWNTEIKKNPFLVAIVAIVLAKRGLSLRTIRNDLRWWLKNWRTRLPWKSTIK